MEIKDDREILALAAFLSVAGENVTVIYSVCFSGTSRKIAMIWLKNENLKTHALLFFLGTLN